MAGLQLLTAFLLVVVSTVQGANHQGNCPEIQLPNNSNGTCLLNDQCSQVTCTSPKDDENPFGHMVLTVQVTKCQNKLKAAVSMDSNDHVWARLLGDGDKAELPSPPGMPGPKPYLKVNLKENGDKVHFKLLMLMEPGNFSVTLLEGELRAVECTVGEEANHDESCPGIQLPKESNGTCALSEKCSKVTCTSPEDETKPFGKAVLTVKVEECQGKLKAIVSIRSPGQTWSHEFEDGDKAVMPTPPGMQGSPELNMMVDLKENGNKVHFKLVVLVTNYDFTLLEGELHASKCDGEGGSKQTKQCPAVEFIPDKPGAGKCSFSQQCSKLECVAEGDGHKLIADFKVSRCGKSLVASVKLQQPEEDLDWSERLKDGEKAKLPIKASSFTGGLPVSDAKLFVQVHLKEMQDNRVNFTVRMTGHLTALGETVQVNTVLIQGQIAVSSVADCGSWFSEQSTAVKVLVILVPITAGILLTLTVVFCCCKRRRDGTRLYVNIFKSRNDDYGMRRLANEL